MQLAVPAVVAFLAITVLAGPTPTRGPQPSGIKPPVGNFSPPHPKKVDPSATVIVTPNPNHPAKKPSMHIDEPKNAVLGKNPHYESVTFLQCS